MSLTPFEQATVDPIAALVRETRLERNAEPVLLEKLQIDVTLDGGLVLVETKRTYRNDGEKPIEALLTVPVPVHAAFFGLTAKIGDRRLEAQAQASEEARTTFEEAIDSGKSAVLHEELLRGIHMISAANVMPGTVMEVTTRWAESLRCEGNHGRLRIPLTVGDVYGTSGLADSDELISGGPAPTAFLSIRHDAESVRLSDGQLQACPDESLSATVPSNAPVDIEVVGWRPGVVNGQAYDGREVSLRIEPCEEDAKDLNVAVLVDHSGSMASQCSGPMSREGVSKHHAVRRGLRVLAQELCEADRLSLWEFDHDCNPVGRGRLVRPEQFGKLVTRLARPSGGTEIGCALDLVLARSRAADILLITDGLSYALDVQRYALEGRRIFVVLVGEDSLEARVGHLAAVTGGDTHFTIGSDIERTLRAALQGLRSGHAMRPDKDAGGMPNHVSTMRGNAKIEAVWADRSGQTEREPISAAAAAFATSLALASASEEIAKRLAIGEGLVTHLTSLVLVDQAGERCEELPVTRKIGLPTPRSAAALRTSNVGSQSLYQSPGMVYSLAPDSEPIASQMPTDSVEDSWDPSALPPQAQLGELQFVSEQIDWSEQATALIEANLHELPSALADEILELAMSGLFKVGAKELGIDPIRLVVAILAARAIDRPRNAKRVLRRVLRGVDLTAFMEFESSLGL